MPDAGLGSRAHERARKADGPLAQPFGAVAAASSSLSATLRGRGSFFNDQFGVSHPPFNQLRPLPRPGSSDSAPLIKSRTRVSGGSEAGGWTRHGHDGADHSSGRPGRVPCPDKRASAYLSTQWCFSLPCRRNPRTSRHLSDGNILTSRKQSSSPTSMSCRRPWPLRPGTPYSATVKRGTQAGANVASCS